MSRFRMLMLAAAVAAVSSTPLTAWGAPVNDGADQAAPPSAPAARQPVPDDPDLDFQPLQPDYNLVNLPTGLRVARNKSAFRVTHRFTQPLNEGDFTHLLENFFTLDSSAQIGLEYRYGIFRGTQAGIRRTNDRNIEFFALQSVWQQQQGHAVSITAFGSMDGTNNFRESYSPALGAIVSRTLGRLANAYLMPMWVNNTNEQPADVVDDNNTFLLGIGSRVRLRRTVYFSFEITPRVAGYSPGSDQMSFAIEKVVGGHMFQFNFSNGIATSIAPMARGAASNDDWYFGFNISRKFF